MRRHRSLSYFTSSLATVLGIILIWRGLWYALDYIDSVLFADNHVFSVVGGIIIGFLILYLPDRDLEELRKL